MRLHPDVTPEDLYTHLLNALRAWHDSSLDHRLDFLLLVREAVARNSPDDPHALRRITNELLLKCLNALSEQHPEDAEILRNRFIRKETIVKVAYRVNLSPDQVNKRQKQAILRMAADLLERELALRNKRQRELETRLESRQYTRLFGVRPAVDALVDLLLPGEPPWIITLYGMGGIGKTALAHCLCLEMVADYRTETILWVRTALLPGVEPQPDEIYRTVLNELVELLGIKEGSPDDRRTQVLRTLQARPYLVVIDNLEREQDTAYLVEQFSRLSGPGKILLTTRSGSIGVSGVHNFRVPELDAENAAALVRFHSHDIGMGDLAITDDADIAAIYAAVGGNPLALKLLVGLTARIPLAAALADLHHRNISETENTFHRVYARAWESLSPEARDLLEGMLLVSDEHGAAAEQLMVVSGLDQAHLWPAVQELLSHSLLETHGTASERRYAIHQLTRTFLQNRLD